MHCPTIDDLPSPSQLKNGWPWTEGSPALPALQPNGEAWPKVSIVTPSYNQGEYIEETIRSVLLQGYPNLEYIIMDGGSNDASIEIIQKYSQWLTDWVSEGDRGQTHAVNKGFERCSGDILAWMNSDDTYEPGAIAAAVQAMTHDCRVNVVYGNIKMTDGTGNTLTELRSVPFHPKAFLYETVHITSQSAVFWTRSLLLKVGMVKEELNYAMDRDLLIRFMEAGATFKFLRRTLGTYRCHRSAKSSSEASREELLSLPQMAAIHRRSDYAFWRFIFRLRQWTFLLVQGDLLYMAFRAFARIQPTAFDRR